MASKDAVLNFFGGIGMHSLTPLIAEAERTIIAACKHYALKVKPEHIVITIQSKGKRNAKGWYAANHWKNTAKEALHEINLSAECLKAYDMGELLLHELAHAENRHLGVMDCTANQVHNKFFKAMAERLGLTVKPRDNRYGYGFTELGPDAKAFLGKMAFKHQLFALARMEAGKKEKKKGSRLRLYECACGTKLRVAKDDLDVTCNVCEEVFVKQ